MKWCSWFLYCHCALEVFFYILYYCVSSLYIVRYFYSCNSQIMLLTVCYIFLPLIVNVLNIIMFKPPLHLHCFHQRIHFSFVLSMSLKNISINFCSFKRFNCENSFIFTSFSCVSYFKLIAVEIFHRNTGRCYREILGFLGHLIYLFGCLI